MKSTDRIPVLIVDDRTENLTSLEALLGDMELELVKAQSGNEALRHILYNDFALVLLDVQMPEMDGFETATLMRENPKTRHLPIIFVTAGMKEEYHQFRGYEAGAVDYLMKPIEPAILRSKVRVFCDLYSQRQELKRMKEELEVQNEKLRQTYQQLQEETAERLRAVEELRQKDQIMIQQGRIAAMGEMLNNIAHQWRQPLNVLGLKIQEIGFFYDYGECSKEFLEANVGKAMEVLRHLSQTIDDFRDFSSPDKEKTVFSIEQVVGKTLSLVMESFNQAGIGIDVSISDDPQVNGYPNEYRQVLLNILMNAKDAVIEQERSDGRVTIRSWSEPGKTVLTISDNAGGIKEEHLDKIFDAYYTTKELGKGTGIGLFMAKNIIEKNMAGRLTVRNVEGGAEFRIET
jgi:C4-dicarboxylate-specific signal transduction histidine kinase